MAETRTLHDIDRDLTELQTKRQQARTAREHDYVIVLTAAINRCLDERRSLDAPPRGAGPVVAADAAPRTPDR